MGLCSCWPRSHRGWQPGRHFTGASSSFVSQHTEKRVPLGHTQEKEFSEQEAHAQLLSLSCFQTWILDCKSILIKQLDLPAEWKC